MGDFKDDLGTLKVKEDGLIRTTMVAYPPSLRIKTVTLATLISQIWLSLELTLILRKSNVNFTRSKGAEVNPGLGCCLSQCTKIAKAVLPLI